jgi:Ca-activated chloride channel family protein
MIHRYNIIAVLAALVLAVMAGPQSFGKLAMLAGYPEAALHLLSEPATRGVALYQLGRYSAADEQFAKAGRAATYDRAATLALTGQYDLSVAYYNAVLFAKPDDVQARLNRDLVESFTDPVTAQTAAYGRIAAVLNEAGLPASVDEADSNLAFQLPSQRSVRKPIDARSVVAGEDWLNRLANEPGEYLKKRLAAERQRRTESGQSRAAGDSEW